jgi:glycosyltransferase involved in cell wall biosynthesis
MDKPMIVCALPLQPHSLAFGGFEIQMLETLKAVQDQGVDARPLNPWGQDDDFDILHVWGLSLAHEPAVQWAKHRGKKVVMTALLPYPSRRFQLGWRIRSRYGVIRREQALLDMLDGLVVLNDKQFETAHDIYRLPHDRIGIIPNVVDDCFFSPPPGLSSPMPGRYVMVSGNVSPRKNQLLLAQACADEKIPLLVVGELLAEAAYGAALTAAITANPPSRWLGRLEAKSDELIGACLHSAGVALPSYDETQPLSLLEGGIMGRPILVSDKPYARQAFYRNAVLVDPASKASLRAGLRELWDNPQAHVPPYDQLKACRAPNIGAAYRDFFQRVLHG